MQNRLPENGEKASWKHEFNAILVVNRGATGRVLSGLMSNLQAVLL
jgi:hypothetical protein